jgi:hypothetical protein
MAEALAVVKVGNSEWEFLKLTPRSRTSAIAGAVSGLTIRPRNPSGTNRMTLCGRLFCEKAASADSKNNPIDNIVTARRIFEFSEIIETTGQQAGIVV